eukprot:1000-Heterococcus_DN1.PRE.5
MADDSSTSKLRKRDKILQILNKLGNNRRAESNHGSRGSSRSNSPGTSPVRSLPSPSHAAGNGSQFGWAVVSANSSASAAAAAAAVQHNSVVTVSQEASLDELVQPLTAEEAEVELESYMLQSQSNSPMPNSSFGSSFGSSRLLLTPQYIILPSEFAICSCKRVMHSARAIREDLLPAAGSSLTAKLVTGLFSRLCTMQHECILAALNVHYNNKRAKSSIVAVAHGFAHCCMSWHCTRTHVLNITLLTKDMHSSLQQQTTTPQMYYSGASRIDAANLPGASSPPGSSATATDVSATSHGHSNSNSSSSGSGSGINSSSKYKLKSPQRPSSRNGGLMTTSSSGFSNAAPAQQQQQQQHQHKARALSFSAAVGAAVGATVGGSRLSTGNGSSSNSGAGGIDSLLRGIDTLYGTKRGHIHTTQHTVIPALPPPAGVNFDAVPFNRRSLHCHACNNVHAYDSTNYIRATYQHLHLQPDGHSASWLDAWLRPEAAAHSSSSGSSASHKTFRKGSPRGARHTSSGSGGSSATAAAVPMADIYAIGLQEMVDLNAVNVAVDKKSQSRSAKCFILLTLIAATAPTLNFHCILLFITAHTTTNNNTQWEARIGAALSRDGVTYVRVLKEHLVGTWLCVYAKQSLVPLITDARAGTVSSGMLGVMGNKRIEGAHLERKLSRESNIHTLNYWLYATAVIRMLQLAVSQHSTMFQHRVCSVYYYGLQGAVSIRLCIRDSSLCFVCAHLAAHRENVAARNDNYHKVTTSLLCTYAYTSAVIVMGALAHVHSKVTGMSQCYRCSISSVVTVRTAAVTTMVVPSVNSSTSTCAYVGASSLLTNFVACSTTTTTSITAVKCTQHLMILRDMAFTPVQQPLVPPPLALSSPLTSPFASPPESPHDYHCVKYPLPIPSFVPPEYTAPQPPTETTCSSGSSNVAGSSSSGAAVSSAATTAANSDSESQEGGMTFREFLRGHMRESSEELSAAARSSEEPAAGGKGDGESPYFNQLNLLALILRFLACYIYICLCVCWLVHDVYIMCVVLAYTSRCTVHSGVIVQTRPTASARMHSQLLSHHELITTSATAAAAVVHHTPHTYLQQQVKQQCQCSNFKVYLMLVCWTTMQSSGLETSTTE